MTTIAGLHVPGWGTVVASDSRVSSGPVKHDIVPCKWFFAGGWGVGVAGHMRCLNLIGLHTNDLLIGLKEPEEFSQRLRQVFEAYRYTPESPEEGGGERFPNCMLLASRDGLWEVDGDGCILQVPAGDVWAVGSGKLVALGAGFALKEAIDPTARIRRVMETALHFDAFSGPPIFIRHLTEPTLPPKPARKPSPRKPASRSRKVRA